MADRPVAAGHGHRGLHQPRRLPVVSRDKLRALLDMGVDCFKTDFGERIPTDVVYARRLRPGEDAQLLLLPLQQDRVRPAARGARARARPCCSPARARRAASSSRSIGAATAIPTSSRWRKACAAGCRSCLSGFGFWSHDIGGFEGTPPADVYKRWVAFGLLSSHSRLHGSSSYRVPWVYDDEAVDVLRFFTKLKCRLMPYLFAQAVEAHQIGRADDAGDDAGVPRRPGLRHAGPPVPARRVAAGRPGLLRRQWRGLLRAGRPLDGLPDRANRCAARAGCAKRTTS